MVTTSPKLTSNGRDVLGADAEHGVHDVHGVDAVELPVLGQGEHDRACAAKVWQALQQSADGGVVAHGGRGRQRHAGGGGRADQRDGLLRVVAQRFVHE